MCFVGEGTTHLNPLPPLPSQRGQGPLSDLQVTTSSEALLAGKVG